MGSLSLWTAKKESIADVNALRQVLDHHQSFFHVFHQPWFLKNFSVKGSPRVGNDFYSAFWACVVACRCLLLSKLNSCPWYAVVEVKSPQSDLANIRHRSHLSSQ